jgi:hypothetical protein
MHFNPLQNASPELLAAVEAMGGEALLTAIDDLVRDNEEDTVAWFDAQWDDLAADEIIEWSIVTLVGTGPAIAHAALDLSLRTYAVEDDDDDAAAGDATMVTAFVRIVLDPQIEADRFELDVRDLGEWIRRDAIRLVGESDADPPDPPE